MNKIKICETCLKTISKKDNYFKLDFIKNKKIVSTKYIHEKCHLELEKQKQNLNKVAQGLAGNLKGLMQGMGINEVVNLE